jgi:N-acyl-D-aspartate/D-glutamate deacylase
MKPSADGILIKGYFDVHTHYSGSFIKGGPVYIQSSSVGRTTTGGGYLSGAAPSAADSYVRVVGYGTDTANVIYFNPDSTYVELA